MNKSSGLVPTVITNKNGVLTTVYRRPGKTVPPSRRAAPTAPDGERDFYLLRRQIEKVIAHPSFQHHEHYWRKRVLNTAIETNDIALLQHLKTHFNSDGHTFETALEAVHRMEMDHTDSELFAQVLKFVGLASSAYPTPNRISTFIPMVLEQPEKMETIAHHMNVLARAEDEMTPEIITSLMNQPLTPSKLLPAHLASTLPLSNTPVTDRKLVYTALNKFEDKYAYNYLHEYDNQTIGFFAKVLTRGGITPEIARAIIKGTMTPRAAVEFFVMVDSVSDLIGQIKGAYEADVCGPNRERFIDAFNRLHRIYSNDGPSGAHPLPIDTEEGVAIYSALFRFLLTIESESGRNLYSDDVAHTYTAGDQYDRELIDLLARRNSQQEVKMIVTLFNERGYSDAKTAESYLDDQSAPALAQGWL